MLALGHRCISPGEGHAAGRQLLEELVTQVTGQSMPPIALGHRGKPYFTQGDLHFSITHTPGHVFCALSHRPIGIDAEELTRAVQPALAKKILSPGEYTQYAAAQDQNRALLTFWVLKEALTKCSGEGMRGYGPATDFSLTDPRVTCTQGCLLAVIEEDDHAV